MRKIKLVIADDETSIRNAMCNMIDWESKNIEICGIAKDGKEALEKIKENEADIALLDIRMPIMTGLEVLSEIKRQELKTKAIILSGYDDFSYAKEALLQGVSNYLLKPCRPEQVLAAVLEVQSKIQEEQLEELQIQKERIELESSRYDVRNKRVADFILTRNEMMIAVCEEKLEYDLGEKGFCLVMKPSDQSLLFVNHQQFIIEQLEKQMPCIAGCVAENIVAVISENEKSEKKLLREFLMKLKQLLYNKYAIIVSIGVGNVVNRSDGLKSSYQNALKALDMIHFFGTDFVIFYDSIYVTQNNIFPSEIEKEIIEAIKNQDIKQCNRKVDEFFYASHEENGGSGIIKNAIAILLSLYHFTITSGYQADVIFGRPLELMEQIHKSKDAEDLSRKIKAQCNWIIEQGSDHLTENHFVNAAILFMRRNFHKDLNLSMVAEEIFITPGYLSTLFKQALGDNFINYLNRLRIEKACELLKDVRLKNFEIAYQVGFQDEKYFSKVFKKIMGVSPNQYKKRCR